MSPSSLCFPFIAVQWNLIVMTEIARRFVERTVVLYPFQQRAVRIVDLHLRAGVGALSALRAGEHQAFDLARLDAHRADVVTGGIAVDALLHAAPVEADHHRLAIAHPDD